MPEIESSSSLSFHVKKCVSIKEANSLLDSYHAKEDKFRIFMESNLGPVSSTLFAGTVPVTYLEWRDVPCSIPVYPYISGTVSLVTHVYRVIFVSV